MKHGILFTLVLLVSALALSGCGQRVYPADPAGKVRGSTAY